MLQKQGSRPSEIPTLHPQSEVVKGIAVLRPGGSESCGIPEERFLCGLDKQNSVIIATSSQSADYCSAAMPEFGMHVNPTLLQMLLLSLARACWN